MKTFCTICLTGILLLVASCAVGPDYSKPTTATPAAWHGLGTATAPLTSITTPQPAELVEWWKGFNDQMLTSLVERAIESNLDLRQAEARIRQARAQRGVVASGLWPQVDVTASYSNSRSGGSQDLFQAGLDATWELDIFGGVRRDVEASQADFQAAVEDRRDVLVSLVAEIGGNYISLRGFQQQIIVARKNLEAQKHTAGITRKRYEAGFVSGLDIANADAQVATTESQIPVLESSAQATIYSLGVLLGREPAALAEELAAEKALPLTPPEVPVGLPSDLIRRRPDIRRAEAQLHAATARIGVATADLFPKFSLTGSFGLLSSDISSLGNWSSRFWSYGPTVRWPIFEAGRIRWNIEVQNAVQEQGLTFYEKTVLTALKDVETALVAYAKEQEHLKSLSEAVKYNRRSVDLSMKLYITGKIDFLNVLSAQRSLYTSEDALIQSTGTLATDLIALYKALGGGWEKGP
jgi:NodT family efflux transporter outer membrane factor (OMF) lipoprotein